MTVKLIPIVRLLAKQAARDLFKPRTTIAIPIEKFQVSKAVMRRVAIYAGYSSDNQYDVAIEEQSAVCRRYAERQGWTVVDCYADRVISGASLLRPGIQSLMKNAGKSAGRLYYGYVFGNDMTTMAN